MEPKALAPSLGGLGLLTYLDLQDNAVASLPAEMGAHLENLSSHAIVVVGAPPVCRWRSGGLFGARRAAAIARRETQPEAGGRGDQSRQLSPPAPVTE